MWGNDKSHYRMAKRWWGYNGGQEVQWYCANYTESFPDTRAPYFSLVEQETYYEVSYFPPCTYIYQMLGNTYNGRYETKIEFYMSNAFSMIVPEHGDIQPSKAFKVLAKEQGEDITIKNSSITTTTGIYGTSESISTQTYGYLYTQYPDYYVYEDVKSYKGINPYTVTNNYMTRRYYTQPSANVDYTRAVNLKNGLIDNVIYRYTASSDKTAKVTVNFPHASDTDGYTFYTLFGINPTYIGGNYTPYITIILNKEDTEKTGIYLWIKTTSKKVTG